MNKIHPKSRQVTIRNVPLEIDEAIKRRARQSGKSINETFLEVLIQDSGEVSIRRRNLGFVSGSLSRSDAQKLEKEIERQHFIDERLWK